MWQIANFPGVLGSLANELTLPHIDGVREAIFREAIILARKFSHCRSLVRIAASEGRSTWASVTAYEACFYGAKALCYLLGFASIGRSSSYLLDAFFEVIVKQRKGLIEERYDMKLHKLPERMTHAVLWGLTERLINTITFGNELSELKSQLRKIDWDNFSKFRNSIMYDGSFWTKLDSYEECDLINFVSDINIYRVSDGDGNYDQLPFAEEYFRVVQLLASTLSLMFADLATLAPVMDGEARSVIKVGL